MEDRAAGRLEGSDAGSTGHSMLLVLVRAVDAENIGLETKGCAIPIINIQKLLLFSIEIIHYF